MQKIKLIAKLLPLLILFFVFTGNAFAATSVRLQQPQNPTNKNAFNITFVALDTNSSQTVTVQCQKKGPTDADFVNFGSPITLSNGGNTNNCEVGGGLINQNGTYKFRAIANGSGAQTSNEVNVDFNDSTPGNPGNYKKEKVDSCTYKIWFHTADDSGKTVKVVLYRSTNTNFSVDSAHQVNELNISSNTDGSMTDNVSPNCDTTYYYVIRAFDVYGNGSGVVGDSNTTTNTVSPPTTTQAQSAIPVGGGNGGQVLGDETTATEEIKGDATESAGTKDDTSTMSDTSSNPIANTINWILTHKKISLLILISLFAVVYLYRRYKK